MIEKKPEETAFLTLPQVAKILRISRIAVYKQVKLGKLKAFKIGRNYVVPKEELFHSPNRKIEDWEKTLIEKTVRRTIKEYGWVLRKLGQE